MPKQEENMPRSIEDYEVHSDLRILMEASKIKKDKKRMAAVRKLAKEKLAELAKFSEVN